MSANAYGYLPPDSPERKRLIKANVATLQHLQRRYIESGIANSFAELLSGSVPAVSQPPEGQGAIPIRDILKQMGVHHEFYVPHQSGSTYNFQCAGDYNKVAQPAPMDGLKVYLSLDLSTPEKLEVGSEFYRALVEAMLEADTFFTAKHWSHAYDALLLYTHNLTTTAVLLADLYKAYQERGLFLATEHFLQAPLAGIHPDHAGWVHEPLIVGGVRREDGRALGSHSMRLGDLGAHLDVHGLSPASYEEGASPAGIDPAQPHMIDRTYYHGYALLPPAQESGLSRVP